MIRRLTAAMFVATFAAVAPAHAQDDPAAMQERLAALEAKVEKMQTQVQNPVAIIELNTLAQALGRDQEFNAQLRAKQQELQASLEQSRRDLANSTQAEAARIRNEVPMDQQDTQLKRLQAEAIQQMQRDQQEAQREIQMLQANFISSFREEVKPFAQRIAAERHCLLVLTQTDAILVNAPTLEITDEVIAAMKEAGKSASSPSTAPAPILGPSE